MLLLLIGKRSTLFLRLRWRTVSLQWVHITQNLAAEIQKILIGQKFQGDVHNRLIRAGAHIEFEFCAAWLQLVGYCTTMGLADEIQQICSQHL